MPCPNIGKKNQGHVLGENRIHASDEIKRNRRRERGFQNTTYAALMKGTESTSKTCHPPMEKA